MSAKCTSCKSGEAEWCMPCVGNEIDAYVDDVREDYDANPQDVSGIVREWLLRRKTLGLISVEAAREVELCADDLEAGR